MCYPRYDIPAIAHRRGNRAAHRYPPEKKEKQTGHPCPINRHDYCNRRDWVRLQYLFDASTAAEFYADGHGIFGGLCQHGQANAAAKNAGTPDANATGRSPRLSLPYRFFQPHKRFFQHAFRAGQVQPFKARARRPKDIPFIKKQVFRVHSFFQPFY